MSRDALLVTHTGRWDMVDRAREVSELLLEYRLSELLRLQGSVAEGDGVGRANRSLTRRVERIGVDVVFYYRY